MPELVLLRHGQSAWNLENRFTGWTDVDLTEHGRKEALSAAELLKQEGYTFDKAFTSLQKRAIRTLWIVIFKLWAPSPLSARPARPTTSTPSSTTDQPTTIPAPITSS